MKKFLAWIFLLGVTLAFVATGIFYYVMYGLFWPHSGIVFTGYTLYSWKSLLVLSYFSLGLGFVHSYLAGKALWDQNIKRGVKISLIGLMIVAILVVNAVRR